MNILIVDDIEDNREILQRLIKQYSRKYDVAVNISQAQNGQDGVNLCNEKDVDLVFMDIVMPVMDGLEATKIIKKEHPNIMIIVISSENDEDIKTQILQAGAEDYVLKPFSSVTMLSRLNNYQRLINSRNTIGFQPRAINVFTNSVYSYQVKFFINSDDELAQFWETMLVRLEFQHHIDHLSDFVRFLFQLGSIQLQRSYKCHVYLEEDEHNFYFTMDNMKLLSIETIHQIVTKYCEGAIYEIKEDLLSFALPRVNDNISTSVPISEPEINLPESPAVVPVSSVTEQTLQTYDFLDAEELEEFEFIITKLQTEISMMGTSSLEIDDIDTMNEYIKKLASLLSLSQDAYAIASSLNEFSALLDEYSEPFLEMSKELSHMMTPFINDLFMWKEMIFHTGAPSPDFLNSSISSNVKMIKAIFVTEEVAEEDLGDIFDF